MPRKTPRGRLECGEHLRTLEVRFVCASVAVGEWAELSTDAGKLAHLLRHDPPATSKGYTPPAVGLTNLAGHGTAMASTPKTLVTARSSNATFGSLAFWPVTPPVPCMLSDPRDSDLLAAGEVLIPLLLFPVLVVPGPHAMDT